MSFLRHRMLRSSGGAGGAVVSTFSYDNASFEVLPPGTFTVPYGMTVSNDGTKLYIVEIGFGEIHQFSLSTPFDVTTLSYDDKFFLFDNVPTDIVFNNDGTKLFVLGYNSLYIRQFSLSTPFDVTTLSYDNISQYIGGKDDNPSGIALNDNGTKLYITGSETNNVFQFELSTPYDLSTLSVTPYTLNLAGSIVCSSIEFNKYGSKIFIVDFFGGLDQLDVSTPFDLSTASNQQTVFDLTNQTTRPKGVVFNEEGTKMLVLGEDPEDRIYQYSSDV